MIEQQLKAMGAPRSIVDGGKLIDERAAAKLSPPRDVVQWVAEWVTRNQGNNRYGK